MKDTLEKRIKRIASVEKESRKSKLEVAGILLSSTDAVEMLELRPTNSVSTSLMCCFWRILGQAKRAIRSTTG